MKFTKYLFSFAAAAGLFAACQPQEMVQIATPENITPAVLHELEVDEIAISADNQQDTVVFSWSAADYGANTSLRYSIEASLSDDGKKVTLASGIADTTASVTYEDLNRVLFNDLEVPEGQPTELKIYVGSIIYSGAVTASYPKVYSQPVSMTVTVTAAEKVYPMLTVAGSYAYNNWAPGKGEFVFDFDGTNEKYSGMIDFGEDVSALAFKFVGAAWGQDEFSVPSGESQAAEAAELTLVAGGGDNISAYTTHRYYNLTLDKTTPKVIKNFSFNSIGVIGDATPTGWDSDTDMQFNIEKQRFYVDLTLTDGTIKFRADDGWDVNWGVTDGAVVAGGGDIPVKAGNYRIYLNMNNPAEIVYTLDAGMYGKEEPTAGTTPEPEPEPTPTVQGWGLVGEYNGWGGTPDVMLASDGTYLVAKGVELSGQVKFRKDGDWAVNFGAPGDVEPVEIAVNTELELAAGGKNFTIAAGKYDVYLDEANAKAWFINDGSYPGGGAAPVVSEWGLIGVAGDWNNNVPMYEEGEWIVARNVTFTDNNEFKFRKGNAWGTELVYEGVVSPDAEYACAAGSGNSKIAQGGTYDVYLAATLDKFYVMTPGKTPADAGEAVVTYIDPSAESFVVGFSGSALGWDDPAFDTNDRATFVSKNVTDAATYSGTYEFKLEGLSIAAEDQFKVRINGQWIGDGGAVVEGLAVTAASDGNFIAGEAGTYTTVITFAWDGSTHSDVKVVFSK